MQRCLIGLSGALVLIGMSARATDTKDNREDAVAAIMQADRHDARALRMFLLAMPKGGELHIHSWGTAFAEDDLRWAEARGFCGNPTSPVFVAPPCKSAHSPALASPEDKQIRSALSAALTEASETGPVVPRHDHFFATFDVAAPVISLALTDELALLRQTEATQNAAYVEFMSNPDAIERFGQEHAADPFDPDHLQASFAKLEPGLAAILPRARAQIDARLALVDRMQHCDGRQARVRAACAVTVRFLATILRTEPPAQVFAAMVAAFALVHSDPLYVGVNILGPEDDPVARRDYRLHMRMFRFLAEKYPDVHLSLHAGELTDAIAPAADLRFHIAGAVGAGASRIGHGIDIAREDDDIGTLSQMASRKIAIEINLTSNSVILGVRGREHPLALYMAHGVPVVLSTDDPGVFRTDLTREYERAVVEQGLDYHQLKRIARNALEFSFLPGASLWRDRVPGQFIAACADVSATTCTSLMRHSSKAALEWRLEGEIAHFEDRLLQRHS